MKHFNPELPSLYGSMYNVVDLTLAINPRKLFDNIKKKYQKPTRNGIAIAENTMHLI